VLAKPVDDPFGKLRHWEHMDLMDPANTKRAKQEVNYVKKQIEKEWTEEENQ